MLNQNENGNGFAAKAMLLFALTFFVSVCAVWLPRGLPDAEKVSFYPQNPAILDGPQTGSRFYRSSPLETFNHDEAAVLNALSNMNPSKGDFNPRFFNYPTFFIYQIGAELALLSKAGIVKLTGDKVFYFSNPGEIAKMYLAGRILSVIYGLLTLLLVYKLTEFLTGGGFRAAFAVLLLCLMPNWIRESCFMISNTAQAFFMTAAVYLSFKNLDAERLKPFLFAGVLAGLAAGCKYPGGAAAFIPAVLFLLNSKRPLFSRILGSAAVLGLAALVFFITSPYCLLNEKQFSNDIAFVASSFPGPVPVFYRVYPVFIAAGPAVLLIFILAFLYFCRRFDKARLVFWGWFLLTLWVPFVSNSTYMRYWAPVLPAMAVLAAVYLEKKILRFALFALVPAAFLYTLHFNILTQASPDPRVRAARWIEENIPGGSKVAARRMHFDMPPINNEKYSLYEEQGMCPQPGTEWFILRERYPSAKPCGNFKRVKSFSNRPFLFGFESFSRDLGDMAFTHLKIDIYKAES